MRGDFFISNSGLAAKHSFGGAIAHVPNDILSIGTALTLGAYWQETVDWLELAELHVYARNIYAANRLICLNYGEKWNPIIIRPALLISEWGMENQSLMKL